LEEAKQYGVYEPELSRVWPRNGESRKVEIELFAKKYGFRLRYYKDEFCAIFDKDPAP
jgi:hypothetical protein